MSVKKLISLFTILIVSRLFCFDFQIARLHYNGGGDWYISKTAIPNLLKRVKKDLKISVPNVEKKILLTSPELYRYSFLYATGHGNFKLSDIEIEKLRDFLCNGGFLWVNDSYGLDSSFRYTISRVFPNNKFVELNSSHPIFRSYYKLKSLPKIHEHNGKRPQLFAIYYKKRIVILFDYESDIGDGLEDVGTYNDPLIKHEMALKMGVNIVKYFLEN